MNQKLNDGQLAQIKEHHRIRYITNSTPTAAAMWDIQLLLEHIEASKSQSDAMSRIIDERQRQDTKWGEQNHLAAKWMLIAQEEMGEVAKSLLEHRREEFLDELVQAAAVMVAWLECEIRGENKTDEE